MPPRLVRLPQPKKPAARVSEPQATGTAWLKRIRDVLPSLRRKRRGRITEGGVTALFTSPHHPPGVFPDKETMDALGIAADEDIQSTWQWAEVAQSAYGSAFEEGVTFLGYAFLSALTQRPEYRVVVETIAAEMTREWIELSSASNDKGKAAKLKQLDEAARAKFKLKHMLQQTSAQTLP